MARLPTVSDWEIDQLRRIDNVVRLGHVRRIERDQIVLERGAIPTTPRHLHVHCGAYGLRLPIVPIFGPDSMTLQPTRGGFACYGAAQAAFVEAHRQDDADKNRVCLPSGYPHDVYHWAACGWPARNRTPSSWGNRTSVGGVGRRASTPAASTLPSATIRPFGR
jgi:hypothetical protein